MNSIIRRVALTSVAAGLLVGAGALTAEPASASGGPGLLCNVAQNTQVFSGAGNGDRIYTVAAGDAVRILDGPFYSSNTGNYYWYGHGNGHTDGYMLADDRYYNCR